MKIEFNNRLKIEEVNLECSFELKKGMVYQLEGENGIGKTTFLAFLKAHQNEFFPKQRAVFVDQLPLIPLNAVSFEDLKLILRKDRYEELVVFEKLNELISDFSSQSLKSLSGGQNQLVKLAISIFLGGDLFFFDEPMNFLDPEKKAKITGIFQELKKLNKTLFIIDHQKSWPIGLIDKTLTMVAQEHIRIVDGV